MTRAWLILRRALPWPWLFVLALSSLTCGRKPSLRLSDGAHEPPAPMTDHVVLIAIDGVRWQDVFIGVDPHLAETRGAGDFSGKQASDLVPNLTALADEGVALGAGSRPMVATGPDFVSLPGYTELFEGRAPTACFTNECEGATTETFLESLATLRPASDVAAFASWPNIARAVSHADARFVVSMGRQHASGEARQAFSPVLHECWEQGSEAAAFPGHADFRPDALTARLALAYLETWQPRLLFLGLGEPDEYAHRGDYRRYLAALQHADDVVGRVRHWARFMRASGDRVTVWVTTDHGRAADFVEHGQASPESARIWAIAAGDGIARRGRAPSPTTRRLADVGPTVRRLLGLEAALPDGSGQVLTEALDTPDARLASH